MLRASELRVGNKFKSCFGNVQTVLSIIDNTDKGRIKVCADCPDDVPHFKSEQHRLMYSHLILCEENGNQYKPCEIEGEPLTEEWLVRFGWFKEGNIGVYYHKDFNYQIFASPDNKYFLLVATNKNIELKYVHKLQNLIFANTDKEMILIK